MKEIYMKYVVGLFIITLSCATIVAGMSHRGTCIITFYKYEQAPIAVTTTPNAMLGNVASQIGFTTGLLCFGKTILDRRKTIEENGLRTGAFIDVVHIKAETESVDTKPYRMVSRAKL